MRCSFFSGVASAMTSSTPASAAMAAAVSGLSPVTITVRMPSVRSSAKRWRIPGLTTSLRCTAPSSSPSAQTSSGVPPLCAMLSISRASSGARPARSRPRKSSTESTAPLRNTRPFQSIPESRVSALNGTGVTALRGGSCSGCSARR